MKKSTLTAILLGFLVPVLAPFKGSAQRSILQWPSTKIDFNWLLTGNARTNPSTNFLGTTDNKPLIIKTNNIPRLTVTSGAYSGVEIGSANAPAYTSLVGQDAVDEVLPLSVTVNVKGAIWGNYRGATMGRLIRLNQGPSIANGGVNFYDIGIGRDTCFFITNHTTPPAFGNGVIRKRMIVISPQDQVGINLPGTDNIGTNAKPTANFHTNGTVRFQNLPSGTGYILVADANGNVFRSIQSATRVSEPSEADTLRAELVTLKKEIEDLKAMVNSLRDGFVRIATSNETQLLGNAPNPFNATTTIRYLLPSQAQKAYLIFRDANGKLVKSFDLSGNTNQSIVINGGELLAGTYFYSLEVDGKIVDTKKTILIR
jgi:hypothetical protein